MTEKHGGSTWAASDEAPSWRVGMGATAACGVLSAGLAWLTFGGGAALGVLAGAGLAVANLWALGLAVQALLGGGRARGFWILVVLGKLALLFGALCLLVFGRVVDILPLAVGIGALPVGIVVAQLFTPSTARDRV